MSVCVYACMDGRLASAWTVRRILIIIGIQELIHAKVAHSKYEHSSSKISTLRMGPKKQNGDFLQNGCNDFH
jgi:hypothetical protein